MNTLDHIQYATEPRKVYDYFVTITLPKCHYRKKAQKQSLIMDALLKRIGDNYAISFIGVKELTLKGNVHAHLLFEPKDFFEGFTFLNDTARSKATVTMLSSLLKQYSMCDVQHVKNLDNVYTYLSKETKITEIILQNSPFVRFYKKPSQIKPLDIIYSDDVINYSMETINILNK